MDPSKKTKKLKNFCLTDIDSDMRYFRREKEVKFFNVQKCPPIGGRCWHTGCPLSTPLGSNVVFQQVGLRAAFCEPRPRLSLIEMLWGCIGKVANPLPKPLGPVVLSNGTQKRKLFRCGSEVIRSLTHFHPFSSKIWHARPLPAKEQKTFLLNIFSLKPI